MSPLSQSAPVPSQPMEFRTPKVWRIVMYVIAIPIILAFSALLVITIAQNPRSLTTWTFITPMCLILIGFFTYALLEVIFGTYSFDAVGIAYTSKLMNRQLAHSDVRGFRTDQNYLHIIPKDRNAKTIKISTYTERYAEIVKFVSAMYENFHDTDPHQLDAMKSDPALGQSESERTERLTRAKQAAKTINIAGAAVAAWVFIYPLPYEAAMIACFTMVIVPLPLLLRFRGLIHVNEEKGSPYPSISLGLILPGLALCIRAFRDFELLEAGAFTPYVVTGGVLLATMYFVVTKEINLRRWTYYLVVPAIVAIMAGYTYGILAFVNCHYDESAAQLYPAEVQGKRFTTGKSTTYYLKLSAWGPRESPEEVSVTKYEYEGIGIGDEVEVHLHEGRLGAAWFYLQSI